MLEPGRRATSLEEMQAIRARFDPSESVRQGLTYEPRSTDVFIATYPKCGTTWLQQILHCLRTDGDMDFAEITAVVPWLEMAGVMGIDHAAAQRAEPRVFKTHLSHDRMPRGGRYVHMIRDPADVLVSMYHFHEGWFFEPGSIDLETYALGQFLQGSRSGNYWDFQASWWPRRGDPDVLYLIYEAALREPEDTIRRIARFAGIEADDDRISRTVEYSSLRFMKAHERQFDDHLLRDIVNRHYELPADSTSTKVRAGRSGEGKRRLTDRVQSVLEERWAGVMEARYGLTSYADLVRLVATPRTQA